MKTKPSQIEWLIKGGAKISLFLLSLHYDKVTENSLCYFYYVAITQIYWDIVWTSQSPKL